MERRAYQVKKGVADGISTRDGERQLLFLRREFLLSLIAGDACGKRGGREPFGTSMPSN
jgi:hypothetical protein